MSLNHKIFPLLLLAFLLPPLINGSPHPQRGGNHRHGRPVESVAVVGPPTITTSLDNSNAFKPQPTDIIDNDDTTTISTPIRGSGGATTTTTGPNGPIITSSPSTGTGGGKRGLAYNSSSPSLQIFANTEITWVHNWYSSPGDAPSEFLFVPTLWSDESPHSDNWDTLAAGHQYLMSFNEPDIVGQANMQVGEAVTAYKNLMFPLRKSGVQIGAPSVSSGSGTNEAGIPMGTGWLGQFLDQCDDENTCVADFVSGHWYGCPSGTCSVSADVSSFQSYVNDLIGTAKGRDVWVPEFQRYGDAGGQQEFLEAVLPWLDSSAVVRYAYYMVVDGILTTGGQVNELGGTYAGV
ncbi:MAG: hypothetical protein L6R42_007574 [Xanthoria sp. 1 TBL-2021]|nr:MAG: hypothetical protein L6R42_007574 [Xanthoria sp. 1 TBL-2021]